MEPVAAGNGAGMAREVPDPKNPEGVRHLDPRGAHHVFGPPEAVDALVREFGELGLRVNVAYPLSYAAPAADYSGDPLIRSLGVVALAVVTLTGTSVLLRAKTYGVLHPQGKSFADILLRDLRQTALFRSASFACVTAVTLCSLGLCNGFARLEESPRLLLHRRDGEDLVLTTAARAEQDQTVVSAATRMLAAMARREPEGTEPLLGILPDAFPWVRFLPESDLHAFAVELVDTMRAADSLGNNASVAQLLTAWRHTAEIHSDPGLLAALTMDHGPRRGLRAGVRPAGRRMTAGRGDRAAPPAPEGHWEVRFADAASAEGRESPAPRRSRFPACVPNGVSPPASCPA